MSTRSWEIEKDILYPGCVVVGGHRYTFTRADAERIAATNNAKIGDGWNVPLCWEHQDVRPFRGALGPLRVSQAEKDREFAKSVFGYGTTFRVDPAGVLKVRLRGDDPADLEQFKKVRFVSPEVDWDWRDSDGRVWRGPTITHIAATPRPTQRQQQPVGARLSLSAGNSGGFGTLEKFVSALRVAPTLGSSTAPRGKLRLSLTDYEAPPMADELDFGGGSGDGTSKGSPWEKIAASLMEHCGIDLGDVSKVSDPEMFAQLVDVATRNYKAGQEPDLDDDLDGLDDDDAPADGAPAGDMDAPPPGANAAPMPPMQMSLTKQREQTETFARKNLGFRIDELERARKITPAIATELRASLPAVRLSFAANAELKANVLTHKLDAYERLEAGAAWNPASPGGRKAARLSHGRRAVARPAHEGADAAKTDEANFAAWQATGAR